MKTSFAWPRLIKRLLFKASLMNSCIMDLVLAAIIRYPEAFSRIPWKKRECLITDILNFLIKEHDIPPQTWAMTAQEAFSMFQYLERRGFLFCNLDKVKKLNGKESLTRWGLLLDLYLHEKFCSGTLQELFSIPVPSLCWWLVLGAYGNNIRTDKCRVLFLPTLHSHSEVQKLQEVIYGFF